MESHDPDSMFELGFLANVYDEQPFDRVVTRFTPEPNDFLHLGYGKASVIDFSFVRYHGDVGCIRYDHVNLTKEEDKCFTTRRKLFNSWASNP